MKKLYLVRHAKSDWEHKHLRDNERPLNERGLREAPEMAQFILKNKKLKPDLIISSTANRAYHTALIFANILGYQLDKIIISNKIYEGGVKGIMQLIQSVDNNVSDLILFGHNPDFTTLAEAFSSKQIGEMVTCSVAALSFEVSKWADIQENNGKLLWYEKLK